MHLLEADRAVGPRAGARIAYWKMLAPRRRPDAFADRVRERAAEAEALHARDRAWFYRAFRLEEVHP